MRKPRGRIQVLVAYHPPFGLEPRDQLLVYLSGYDLAFSITNSAMSFAAAALPAALG